MKVHRIKHLIIVTLLLVAGSLLWPSLCVAEPTITTDRDNADLMVFHAAIMEKHAGGGYLIVAERRVELLEINEGGRVYKTMLKNSRGATIRFGSLEKGTMVFIRGFEYDDGRIMAREIYALPRNVTSERKLKKYVFYQQVPLWEPKKEK